MRNRGYLKPFVKWAGGKGQLIYELESLCPASCGRYFEPFIGGGALLFDLQPGNAVIGDVNSQLINAYLQIRDRPDEVIEYAERLDAVPCTKEHFCEQRDRYNLKIASGTLDAECAGLMIWLNKHCFNGLYRVNRTGMFNVPWNRRAKVRSVDPEIIRSTSEYLREQHVEIRNADFEETCSDVKSGDFVYFDSPYVPVSVTANFTKYAADGFTMEDHERLASFVRGLDRRGVMIMLSNNDVPEVRRLYAGFRIYELSVARLISCNGGGRTGEEVVVTNYDGRRARCGTPAGGCSLKFF